MVDSQKTLTSEPIEATISIPTITDVKTFVAQSTAYCCNMTLISGKYAVDAKSIMGIFSLDLSRPIKLVLEVGSNNVDDRKDFLNTIKSFIVE